MKEAVASIRNKVRLKVIHDFVRIQGDIYDEEPDWSTEWGKKSKMKNPLGSQMTQ